MESNGKKPTLFTGARFTKDAYRHLLPIKHSVICLPSPTASFRTFNFTSGASIAQKESQKMFKKLLIGLCLSLCVVPAFATDLTVTAANVEGVSASTRTLLGQAGEAVTQGEPVYRKAGDSKYYAADCDLSSEAATVAGICATAAATDGFVIIVTSGEMDLGATLTIGAQYVASGNAGGIAPQADLATNDYISSLGFAVATDKFIVNIKNSGYQVP